MSTSVAPPSMHRGLEAPAPVSPLSAMPRATASDRLRTARVFLAALGPMLTVAALRRLVIDQHEGTPASLHLFVALGMMGAAIGAPLLAVRADKNGTHARLAIMLAVIDACATFATSRVSSTALLFAIRPVHGIASMGLLALLFGDLRRTSKRFVAHAGGAMIAALAIGPGLGGALSRSNVQRPFEIAALLGIVVAATLLKSPLESARVAPGATRREPTAPRSIVEAIRSLRAPLGLLFLQRAAIGGFIAAFAVRARASGVSDARIGASFSVFLVVFAITVTLLGRSESRRPKSDIIPLGGAIFAVGFLFLAVLSGTAALPFLALAGAGAGMIYAPCLAIASTSDTRGHASTMALVHAAGAVGMVVGPLVAALADFMLAEMSAPGRGALFLVLAGGGQALAGLVLHSDCRALETIRKIP